MNKEENVRIYEMEYPVFSFDVFEERLIAIIYQADGFGKLCIKNIITNEELYFQNLNVSHVNVKVKFVESGNIVCFDGTKLFQIDFINKDAVCLKLDVEDFSLSDRRIIVLSKKGEIILLDINNNEEQLIYTIDNYKDDKISNSRCLINYKNDVIVVANKSQIISFSSGVRNKPADPFFYYDDVVKYIEVSDSSKYIACILEKKNKLSLLRINNNKLFFVDFLQIQNCSCLRILNDEYLLVGSAIGYISVIDLKSQNVVYSQQLHEGILRTVIVKNKTDIYTAGDDGKIIKFKFILL